MRRCLELAKKAEGQVSPNPMVGCVIVHNEKIIGEGYHQKYKSAHAEVNAINNVKNKNLLKDSSLYVNLEPCTHYGNTPPCTDLIIKSNIPKVFIGSRDIDPKVMKDDGIEKMIKNGITVKTKILEKECTNLNKRFFTFYEKKRPYIILKWAESKDGFIAPLNQNKPLWMSSKESKRLVHKYRSIEDAILVGRITAEKDNPSLTAREINNCNNPIRIILDKDLKLSESLNVFNDDAKTFIFNSKETYNIKSNYFIKINFDKLLYNMLKELYQQKIQSIIVEGGKKTLDTFIQHNMWDEKHIFITDKILNDGVSAPIINGSLITEEKISNDILRIYRP